MLFSSPQSPFSGKRAAEAGYDLTGLKEVKKYPCIFFLTACGKKKTGGALLFDVYRFLRMSRGMGSFEPLLLCS